MTCIVGLIDNDVVYMGADSLASNGSTKFILNNKKVFKLNNSDNFLIGVSGSIRDLNLLQYAENLIDNRDEPNIDHKYMVTKFIPNLMNLLGSSGRKHMDNGISEQESCFLIGYKNNLWTVHFDYSIYTNSDNYESIGSGTRFALGSLETTKDMKLTPIERIRKALQCATKFAVGVEPPYFIMNTKNNEIIEFKD